MTQQEFKTCFDLWFEEIRNYMTYRCCDAELATDLAQEAYIKVWEKNLAYQEGKTKGLLLKIANELWISQYRRQSTEKKYKLNLQFKAGQANQSGQNSTEEQMDYQELKAKYETAIAALPEKRRVVYLMSRMEHLTHQEIAQRLGLTVKAVEKRMNLALQELRKIIDHG